VNYSTPNCIRRSYYSRERGKREDEGTREEDVRVSSRAGYVAAMGLATKYVLEQLS
jgi:hypothetical protein